MSLRSIISSPPGYGISKALQFIGAAALISLVSHSPLTAAPKKSAQSIDMDASGSFVLGGVKFNLVHYDPDWKRTDLEKLVHESGSPDHSGKRWKFQGQLNITGIALPLEGEVEGNPNGEYALNYKAMIPQDLPTETVCLEMELPIESAAGKAVTIDGGAITLPAEYGESLLFSQKATTLVMPAANGTITLEGKFFVSAQDQRKWNGDTFKVRIGLVLGETADGVTPAELGATLRYTPE